MMIADNSTEHFIPTSKKTRKLDSELLQAMASLDLLTLSVCHHRDFL
jgi:hypothetical protein